MNRLLILTAALVLAACASDGAEKEKSAVELKNDAIDDFIKVAELEPISVARTRGEMHHKRITDDYVFVTDRRNTYLVSFTRRCYDLEGPNVTPDFRQDDKTLRARFDTIRGCRIEEIFAVTEGQVEEIESLTEPYENP